MITSMSRSSSFFTLCLSAAAVLLAMPSASAQEPEISFYPTKGWSVATTKSPAGVPQCAISGEYNNGFIVGFKGSDKWVQKTSIDFRQNIFTPGDGYDVAVSVPGQFNQTIQGQAASNTTLELDIRKHTDFYKAAVRSGVFDMNVEGNNFRFYLTSFGTQQGAFEQCMAGRQADVRAASVDAQKTASDDRVNEAMAYEEDETGKVAVKEVLPEEFESNDAPLSLTDRSAEPEDSLSKPQAEILTPPGEVAGDTGTDNEMDGPSLMTPEPQTTRVKSPEIKVTREKKSVRADFTGMAKDESIDLENRAEMARKISELQAQIAKLEAENDVLEGDLTSTLKEGEQERLSISSDNWNLERATMRYNESERQVKRLGQQLQRERTQCSMEKQELEAMLFDPQVTDQAQLAKLADMERQLAEAEQKIEDQRMRYEERIKILESQLQTN